MISKIDIGNPKSVTDWKEFEISKLFTIKSPASRTIKAYSEGDIPYVSSGSFNNGIISYLEPKEGETLEKGGCITVSPLDGSSFYQEEDFLGRGGAGSAISLLYNENLNRYNALFICTIIKISAERFGYSDALTSDNLKTLKIKLPPKYNDDGTTYLDEIKQYSDDGYEPDWLGMEKYMILLEGKANESLDRFQSVKVSKEEPIDTSGWKDFPITDFFELSLPKGDLQVKKVEDGEVPLITPSNYNNGLLQKIADTSESTLYKSNSLTVDMFGNAYYQEEDFFVTAHGHVNVLIPKFDMNKYIGWFMASSIKKMFFYKYDFSDMCTQKVLNKEVMLLPIKENGKPNWEYM
ncbi:MAG: restriction endonuclease subunit S [Lachnospiraceae bacterium]|nr:restriction endonuclease subunit S [Lachnospiraceae bacterium]